jgi:rhodanese-related sulfurtransferase
MASPTEITSKQLSRLIGTPACPAIIDVRIDEDFNDDPRLIPSARRHSFLETDTLAETLAGQDVIIYCQKGLKISQGVAAILRTKGIKAETLAGGQFAWRDEGLPMVQTKALPSLNDDGKTVWVTRHRPKIDRIACPWLIRRFVDPTALFLFVEPGQVQNVADRFGATPFDVEDVFWSHRDERCTFDTMLEEFGLNTPRLDRLATIVRAADTNRHDLAPEAAGLLAASLGLSRMYRDDLMQLDAGLSLYDMFYRWARDATDEGHDWPATNSKA